MAGSCLIPSASGARVCSAYSLHAPPRDGAGKPKAVCRCCPTRKVSRSLPCRVPAPLPRVCACLVRCGCILCRADAGPGQGDLVRARGHGRGAWGAMDMGISAARGIQRPQPPSSSPSLPIPMRRAWNLCGRFGQRVSKRRCRPRGHGLGKTRESATNPHALSMEFPEALIDG